MNSPEPVSDKHWPRYEDAQGGVIVLAHELDGSLVHWLLAQHPLGPLWVSNRLLWTVIPLPLLGLLDCLLGLELIKQLVAVFVVSCVGMGGEVHHVLYTD